MITILSPINPVLFRSSPKAIDSRKIPFECWIDGKKRKKEEGRRRKTEIRGVNKKDRRRMAGSKC